MQNFYGGPNGQSFIIRWIFSTRYGAGNSMEADISMGWKSPIPVGSFVVVSYGLPNDTDYEFYLNQDLTLGKKSYNSTLWRKVYDETKSTNNGINYELIMSMTGNTPRIEFTRPIDVLDADQLPDIICDTTNADKPTIKFRLPQSQVIEKAVIEKYLDVDQKPEVKLDLTTDGTVNEPVLKFKLPVSQRFLEDNILFEELNANILPYVTFDDTNVNEPTIKFWLPQSQVMQSPSTTTVGPDKSPSVSLNNDNINSPKLEFELPRAVKFYYGSLLGERQDVNYTLTNPEFATYGVGDYYINATTGFIYLVTRVDETTCDFEYKACIQSPLPDITTVDISPYTATGGQNIPKVIRSFTNNELTAWKLEFQLPKMPYPDVDYEFVDPVDTGSVSVAPTDTDTITFNFKIPTGSKVFAGTLVDSINNDTSIQGARAGDLYINTDNGIVYILQKNGTWEVQQGSLKGPVGDALHVVRNYEIIDEEDTFATGRDYILSHYKDDDGDPIPLSSDEVFAVTFKDSIILDKETSYWYFYTEDNQWGRVQLTGGIANLIETTWKESTGENPITNKTYSVDYVNKLIGGEMNKVNADKTTFSKEQIYDLLSWGSFADAIAGDDIPQT